MNIKIGHGYDVHQLKEGLSLNLGGIEIPHTKGSLGHSDADVLLHAIADAILGALALGDIGLHFKNTDPQWKNIDSKILLKKVVEMCHNKGYEIGNIDSTLVLEAPKIQGHVIKMREAIANCCNISLDCVSVKATTSETMGFVGTEKGLEAHAVCILFKK